MRAMKDSGIEWIGEIPQNWLTKKLKYCVDLRLEKTADKASSASYIGLEHVSSYTGTLCEDYEAITDFNGDTLDFCEGDVLFGKLRPYLAKAYQAEYDGRCSSEFWVMDPNGIEGKYLLYYVLSHGFISDVDHSTFGVKMPRAEWEYAGNEKIPFPTQQEQLHIAEYLDAKCAEIDALIVAKEKTNALLKERRQSIIYEAVTRGLDPTVPMKDSGVDWIGEIPSAWRIIPLSKVSERMNNGYVGPTRNIFVDSGVRYLQSLHIKEGQIIFDKAPYYVSQEWATEHSLGTVHTGDVLIVQTGDIGQVACVPEEYNECNCHALIIITPRSRFCSGEYLSYLLQSHYGHNQLLSCRTGALHPHLNSGNIGPIKLPFPPLNEQSAIVSYLKKECQESDYTIRMNDMTIEMLREYRQSLIYEAVTGKIEV